MGARDAGGADRAEHATVSVLTGIEPRPATA
jgi:hypothetical protein